MTSLPHNPEAEACIIAKLLVDPSAIPSLVGVLSADDFHDETYGKAWAVMEQNAGNAYRVDATTLKASGVDIGDPLEFLNRATSAPVREYASIITRDALRRRAITALRKAEKQVQNADEAGVYSAVQEAIVRVMEGHRGGGLYALGDLVSDFQPETNVYPWGIRALDEAVYGMGGGDMVVIAARPNVGKTAVAVEMALGMSRGSQYPVMFTTIEMSRDQLVKRISHRAGGIEQFKAGYNLIIHDEPRATTATVRAAAARIKAQHGGIRAVVIDYIQILKDPGSPQHERVAKISGEVKSIGREFDIPVVALSQLNRLSEGREDKKPQLSDLRDSGAIEQDADIVIGLYRKMLNDPRMWAGVLKHRHAPAGAWVELFFDMEDMTVGS